MLRAIPFVAWQFACSFWGEKSSTFWEILSLSLWDVLFVLAYQPFSYPYTSKVTYLWKSQFSIFSHANGQFSHDRATWPNSDLKQHVETDDMQTSHYNPKYWLLKAICTPPSPKSHIYWPSPLSLWGSFSELSPRLQSSFCPK